MAGDIIAGQHLTGVSSKTHWQLTPDNILDLLKDHPHGHFIRAWYDQACQVLGEVEAGKTLVEQAGWFELRIDANFLRVAMVAKKAKKNLERRIKNVYRVRGPENKEYIFWSGQVWIEDKYGVVHETAISKMGYGEVPTFKTTYNKEEDEWLPSMSIQRTKPVYTIPWNEKEIAKLEKSFYDSGSEYTTFYIIDFHNHRKYRISGEDWRKKTREQIFADLNTNKTSVDTLKELTDTLTKAVGK